MLSDTQLAEIVTWQLHSDERCKQAPLTATVDDGVVTLSGSVHTAAEHEAARRAVLGTTGVIDLADEIVQCD
jgi:osmotically-inducible protein OsmY